jgi:hypothetical protein
MPKDTPLGFVFINDHLSCAVTVQPIALTWMVPCHVDCCAHPWFVVTHCVLSHVFFFCGVTLWWKGWRFFI